MGSMEQEKGTVWDFDKGVRQEILTLGKMDK
jgi:hypothetical protein